ncbi:MAG: GntR family transcriptional regulator [Blastochloris sp.]|nr:GntR family transcriptional regulator [Blastochloris sp.]
MEPFIQIVPGSSSPLYQQIADQIRTDCSKGRLKAGDVLPSIRQLAEKLVINPNTVARAYAELVRQGLILGVAGKGFEVCPFRQKYSLQEQERCLQEAVRDFVSKVAFLDFEQKQIFQILEKELAELKRSGRTKERT